ncbi:hypothetical protein BN3590_01859 [Clostridium sp. C105KSO15]|nr:hypothetical protein BN3590_01859 [Clostridium sp. C105KSO15]
MIKIAIVEDEMEYVETLKSYLARYEKDHSVSFQVQAFTDGLDIVSEYTASYDIILLDIQMKYSPVRPGIFLWFMRRGLKVRNLQKENIPDINRIRKKIICSDFLPDIYNRIMVR